MMKTAYKYLKNEQWEDVTVEHADNHAHVTHAGKTLELELLLAKPPLYTFRLASGEIFEIDYHSEDGGNTAHVSYGNYPHHLHIVLPSQAALEDEADASGQAGGDVLAPMPGKVVEIRVKVGDTVDVGQGIIVVEAMKMQNELKAERAGVIDAIKVTVGQTVEGNQLLVQIRG